MYDKGVNMGGSAGAAARSSVVYFGIQLFMATGLLVSS
jgi:hypothetical protein